MKTGPASEFREETMAFLQSVKECPTEIRDFVIKNTKSSSKYLELEDLPKGMNTNNVEFFRIHTEIVGSCREAFVKSVRLESISTSNHQQFLALYFANNSKCLVWSQMFGMFLVFDNGAICIKDLRNQAYNDLRTRADIARQKVNNDMARMLTFVKNQSEKEYLQISKRSRQIKEDGFRISLPASIFN